MVLKLEYQSGELSCGFISKGIRRQFDRVLRELTFLSLGFRSKPIQQRPQKHYKIRRSHAFSTAISPP